MLSRRIETLFKSSRVKRVMFEKITKKVRPSVEEERALKKRVNGFLKEAKKHAKEAKNMTDVSLLHVGWVKKRLNKKLADQVRLAKKFFRAQKVYGAETFIRG